MEYEKFLNYIQESVSKIIGKEKKVSIHKVIKNNDVELDALTINEKISNVSPTIYVNSYYNEYKQGRELGEIVNEILTLYEEHKHNMEFDVELFKDFNKIKHKIVYKIINFKSNKKLLSQVPYIGMLDLAMVFYCIIESEVIGSATALIYTSHMEMWGIKVEQLYKTAKENTPRLLEYEFKGMHDIVKEMLLDDFINHDEYYDSSKTDDVVHDLLKDISEEMLEDLYSSKGIEMYVLTNQHKINGAACMLYDNVLKEFAVQKGANLYILPSSVHEVIIIPEQLEVSKQELTCMVRDVNAEEVEACDVLSNHVYFYDIESDEIRIS